MDFNLPEKLIFSEEMARYPNMWFYVNSSIMSEYREAVYLVIYSLRMYCHIVDDFDQDHHLYELLFNSSEGCDMEARYRRLQFYKDLLNPGLSHDHQLHVRYYFSDLVRNRLERVELNIKGKKQDFYRVALSIHYEVAAENRNHGYVESCPICGRVGEYNIEVERKNACRKIYDPLGVEFLLKGTIRGRKVIDSRGEEVKFIGDMKRDYDLDIYIINSNREDINTPKIGNILIKQIKGAGISFF